MLPVLLPALVSAGGVLAAQWPQLSTPRQALLQAATFSAPDPHVDYALGVPALAGLVLPGAAPPARVGGREHPFFAAMFIAGAAYVLTPPRALTGVFYTDVWHRGAVSRWRARSRSGAG